MKALPPDPLIIGDRVRLRGRGFTGILRTTGPRPGWAGVEWDSPRVNERGIGPVVCHIAELEKVYPMKVEIHWSDAAAEELFEYYSGLIMQSFDPPDWVRDGTPETLNLWISQAQASTEYLRNRCAFLLNRYSSPVTFHTKTPSSPLANEAILQRLSREVPP